MLLCCFDEVSANIPSFEIEAQVNMDRTRSFSFYQRLSCCVASIKLEQIFLHSKEGKASIEGILILDFDAPLID